MSVGTLKISKELRKVLLKVIIGFGCTQLLLGLIIIYIGFRLETRIGSHLPKSNSERSITIFLYIVAVGLITVTLSIIGIRMGLNLAYQPPINNLQKFHDLWITMNVISVILLICFVYTIQEISDSTVIFIKDVFVHGISNYMSDLSWKNTFDYFQSHLKCCGINKYTDWYDTPWISLTQLPQDDANLPKYCRADGQVILPIVPSSCCKPFLVDSFCYSDISQKLKIFEQQGSPVSPSHLYTKGCVLIISEIFSRYTLVLSLMAIMVSFIQIMMVVVGQYLYTSTRNALLMGNPNDAAPGWLFGRGDCGYIGGRPLGYFIADDTIIFHEEYDVYQEDQDRKEKSKTNWIGWKRPSLKKTDHQECLVKDDVDEQCSIKERIKKKLAQFKRKKIISNIKDEEIEIRNTGSNTVEFMQQKIGYNNNKRQRYKNFLKFAKISKSINKNKQITPIIDKMESNSDDDEDGNNTEMNLPYEKNIIYAYPQDYELQRVEYKQNQFNHPKFKNNNDSDHIQKQSGTKNDDRKNLENKRERSRKKKITVEFYDDDEDENDNDQDNLSEILYDLGMSQLKNRI